MKEGYVIGIDPDVKKNGYAMVDVATRKVTISTTTLPVLLETIGVMQATAIAAGKSLKVFVEAGWVNHPNWHLRFQDSKQMAAAKGKSLGRNQQRGLDIIELLEYQGVDVVPVPPLDKIWKGRDRKITQAELEAIMGKIDKTNQEGRDAALLAWYHAGLPIRLSR